MFDQLTDFWEKRGFEIVFWGSIIVIVACVILSIGKEGSYDRNMWSYPSLFDKRIGVVGADRGMDVRPPTSSQPRDSKGELTCRRYLEMRFNKPFGKARPDFLRNQVTSGAGSGGFNLELDCFNPELGLALEYNGVQHYKYTPYFHRSKEAFHNQKYRDEIKKYKCKENGINLIEVPYDVKNIEEYVENELMKLGY